MNGEQVMSRNPKCLTQTDTVRQAALLMRDENVGFLPVCDGDGHIIGTLTDRDIVVRLVADNGSGSAPLGTLMSRDPVVCRPKEDLSDIEKLMEDKHKSRVVCIDDDDRPIGIISLSDIAKYEEDERAGRLLRAITEREVQTP